MAIAKQYHGTWSIRMSRNCIKHLLDSIPYEDLTPEPITLEPRSIGGGYVRPPISDQSFVPEHFHEDFGKD